MQTEEAQELLLEILNHAEEGKFTEFQFITSWREFRRYQRDLKSTKIILKALKAGSKYLFKTYCKEVRKGSADADTLLAYSQMQDVIAFYEKDLAIIQRMLDEYDAYLGKGHFWFSFLGGERTTFD
jgi:hypothetical protein